MNRTATLQTAAETLGPDGPFAVEEPGFLPRDVQQRMAQAVEGAIENRDELVVEAGTGTGKTYAYLVPALLSGRRAIVSTGTKALQDQLFHRDLPRVREVLGVKLKAALLKGRANYLCKHRLEQTLKEGQLGSRAEVAQLQAVRSWSFRTRRGDRAELAAVPEDSLLWPRVTSTSENCLGSECPFFDECFVVKARREAQEADLVVVNHHLLFADLALRRDGFGEILPGAELFVLDEAHQIPELAGQFFSETVSSRQLVELEHDALREAAQVSGAKGAIEALGRPLEPAVRDLRLALHGEKSRGSWVQVLERADVARALDALRDAIERLHDALGPLVESAPGLASCQARADLLAQRLERLSMAPKSGSVHWFELYERGFALSITPLDVAEPLAQFRAQTRAAWVFTSATLAVGGAFELFRVQMGLEDPVTIALPSPFDYARNALCYVPRDLPLPSAPDYTDAVVAALRPALSASQGRAFLLFTSHRALRRAAELLADCGYPLFVQGTRPRGVLLDAFRASGNGVLLGAATFWEGVDVKGEALSLVAIDKLPFAAPDDPVLEARLQTIRENGGNPFAEHQIPSAALALKQGVGRLIRDVTDRGVLVLCDPRLFSAGYGRLFRECLPPMPITRQVEDVEAFFAC